MNWTKEQYAEYLARTGQVDTQGCDRAANPPAKLESNLGDATLGKVQVQTGTGQSFLVRVSSHRKRLLDIDNLCEKYVVDLCRHCGALPSDSPEQTQIEVRQIKVGKGEPEKVVVEVFVLKCVDTAESCDSVTQLKKEDHL